MSILDRYLARTVFLYTGLVMAVLMSLGALFVFIEQQDEIGVGSYTAASAFLYCLMSMPEQVFELLPIGALLGSLIGLGLLARSSEIIAVRAAGVSLARMTLAVGAAGVLLALASVLIGEFVAPPVQQFARQFKLFSKYADLSEAGGGSVWVKDGGSMVQLERQAGGAVFGGVYVFRFADPGHLASIARATTASVAGDGRWELDGYAETAFTAQGGTRVTRSPRQSFPTSVSPEFVGLAAEDPGRMPTLRLAQYLAHLRANGLDTRAVEFALWARIARTVSIAVVVLLALPFSFGSMRTAGSGARTVVGVLIGIGFYLLQRTLESSAQVFNVNPILLAWTPVTLLVAGTAFALRRTR